jgi:hypothetical protein
MDPLTRRDRGVATSRPFGDLRLYALLAATIGMLTLAEFEARREPTTQQHESNNAAPRNRGQPRASINPSAVQFRPFAPVSNMHSRERTDKTVVGLA